MALIFVSFIGGNVLIIVKITQLTFSDQEL